MVLGSDLKNLRFLVNKLFFLYWLFKKGYLIRVSLYSLQQVTKDKKVGILYDYFISIFLNDVFEYVTNISGDGRISYIKYVKCQFSAFGSLSIQSRSINSFEKIGKEKTIVVPEQIRLFIY